METVFSSLAMRRQCSIPSLRSRKAPAAPSTPAPARLIPPSTPPPGRPLPPTPAQHASPTEFQDIPSQDTDGPSLPSTPRPWNALSSTPHQVSLSSPPPPPEAQTLSPPPSPLQVPASSPINGNRACNRYDGIPPPPSLTETRASDSSTAVDSLNRLIYDYADNLSIPTTTGELEFAPPSSQESDYSAGASSVSSAESEASKGSMFPFCVIYDKEERGWYETRYVRSLRSFLTDPHDFALTNNFLL